MFTQLKWGRAGPEQSLMASEPSGLAWLGSPLPLLLSSPALAPRRTALVGCLLAGPECLITTVRKPQQPSLLPSCPPSSPRALPPINCHAEVIRAALSSQLPALSSQLPASLSPLPAEGWLVIDHLGEEAWGPLGRGRTTKRVPLASLKRTHQPPPRRWRPTGFRNAGDLAVAGLDSEAVGELWVAAPGRSEPRTANAAAAARDPDPSSAWSLPPPRPTLHAQHPQVAQRTEPRAGFPHVV